VSDSLWGLVRAVTDAWAEDAEGDVVWSGDHEGRRGVRMRQTVRDFTTVWFGVGDRSLTVEAYVLPGPPFNREEVFRQALARSFSTRRMHFALDPDGDLVLVGRVPVAEVTEEELELLLGEVYDAIEVAFKPLVRLGFSREKSV
jgi:hypothetical protein